MTPPRSGRVLQRLTRDDVVSLKKENKPGWYSDGGNLYLRIRSENTAPAWKFVYSSPGDGRRREYTIGDARDMALALARQHAKDLRNLLAAGTDPLTQREAQQHAAHEARQHVEREAATKAATLAREARRLHGLVSRGFKNPKHAQQWINSLEQHVPPATWGKPIAEVTAGELLEFLQPLYVRLPETAKRVRLRLDHVFDDAMLRGVAPGNPAAAVKRALIKLAGRRKKGSFSALAWQKVPALARQLRGTDGVSARALEFALLTAARTGEALGAQWQEIDIKARTWTVPGARMKAGEPHMVFLSPRAIEIVEGQRGLDPVWVFPSLARPGKQLSNMALLMQLRRLAVASETTVHGLCRASFSTWANERGYRVDVIEACLAHREGDRVRAAYNRAQFLAERKQLLTDWAAFCTKDKAAVASLSAAKSKRGVR